MEFDPGNNIVRLCLQGMAAEDSGKTEEAEQIFTKAWNEAADEFEQFLAAYYLARVQTNAGDKLNWQETALELANRIEDEGIKGVFPNLYSNIAKSYEELGDADNAQKHRELAITSKRQPGDKGPFYHGTRADLQVGDMLVAGQMSNYQAELQMNHIYFTALGNGAGLAAALAKGEGRERVYIIEPTGSFEDDPNVTDKKFPGNPTRSYRTDAPLKIVGELTDWPRQTPEEIQKWRERLDNNKGEIIN